MPTACVLWFMGEAMRNERFAVRERLVEAYRGPVQQVQASIDTFWRGKLAQLSGGDAASPSMAFDRIVRSGSFDGALVLDAGGAVLYPVQNKPVAVSTRPEDDDWEAAERLEHEESRPDAAAAMYGLLAGQATDPAVVASALQARARCLLRAGQRAESVRILGTDLAEPRFASVVDAQGRLLAPAAMLLALDAIGDAGSPEHRRVLDEMVRRVSDYATEMPSGQRLFLMEQVLARTPTLVSFTTMEADRLAQACVTDYQSPDAGARLSHTTMPGVWQIASADGRLVGLLRAGRLTAELEPLLEQAAVTEAKVRLAPTPEGLGADALLTMPASELLPGWTLGLFLEGQDPFATAAERRVTRYLWAGVIVSLVTIVLASVLARYVGRQVRLTRLKNDLIATVSHELKTPLASIRALVDTLLAADGARPQQTREYLELIARENLRLSRLIDNFLTFSRMERRRQSFTFAPVSPGEIAAGALDAIHERFESTGAHVEVDVPSDLPEVIVDRDAMVVVLLNLLDNAWKYTGAQKAITLRVRAESGFTRFEVRDNGIGLSRRSMRKVFRQFYQVDDRLSRRASGCGLGLSIVKFIVDAHGGSVEVDSQLGKGSVFTVRIPAGADSDAGEALV